MTVKRLQDALARSGNENTEVYIRTAENELVEIGELTVQFAVEDGEKDIFIIS